MINRILLILITSLLFSCSKEESEPSTNEKPEQEFVTKATWVTNVASNALSSKENIRHTVENCHNAGINTIFIVVWNKGYTLYPSKIMNELCSIPIAPEYTGWDPLAEMIEQAHKKEIQVHAWFEYGFACSFNQNGGHILKAKPHWAARDINGNLLNKNGFEWMNPFHSEVQNFMLSLILEVIRNYDIDGIQGDDRMPALPVEGGYDDYTVELYKSENNGSLPPMSSNAQDWIDWRANKLTEFQGRLYNAVKKENQKVIVSNAPSIHPWAKSNYLQDWPAWLESGYTDLVMPQHYRKTYEDYKIVLEQQLSYLSSKYRNKFYPGVLIQNGSENPAESLLVQMIRLNRFYGIKGEGFWFYEGINKFPSFFIDYKACKYN